MYVVQNRWLLKIILVQYMLHNSESVIYTSPLNSTQTHSTPGGGGGTYSLCLKVVGVCDPQEMLFGHLNIYSGVYEICHTWYIQLRVYLSHDRLFMGLLYKQLLNFSFMVYSRGGSKWYIQGQNFKVHMPSLHTPPQITASSPPGLHFHLIPRFSAKADGSTGHTVT